MNLDAHVIIYYTIYKFKQKKSFGNKSFEDLPSSRHYIPQIQLCCVLDLF